MRAALARGAHASPVLLAAGVLLGAALFFGGGSSDDRVLWIGGGAVVLACGLAARGFPRLTRAAQIFLVTLAAFVVWSGLSILWSVEPDRSWNYFNRGVTYLAFAVAGIFLGTLVARGPRIVAGGLAFLVGGVVAWALLGKIFPDLYPGAERIARLRSPVGFWNALALLIAMAVPLWLWLAAERRHAAAVRAAGVLALYAGLVALVLTYSRGGIIVAVAVALLWLVLADGIRLESIAALALAGSAALGVSLYALSRHGVADDGQPYSVRVHDGAWFGVVLFVVGAIVCGIGFAAARREARVPLTEPLRHRLTRLSLGTAGAAVGVVLVVVLARSGDPVDWVQRHAKEFTSSQTALVTQGKGRLTDFSSNNRWPWWKDSWHLFKDHPVAGTGAGSFRVAHRRVRSNGVEVLEPHDLPLQFLSETGLVGVALIVAAAVAAGIGIVGAARNGEDPAPVRALALGPVAYGLHGLLDFDWDFIAVSAPLFLAVGVLLGSSARGRPRRFSLLRAAASAALCFGLLYSFAATHFSDTRLNDSLDALVRSDARAAVSAAKSAHSLNPLAIRPYFAWATAEDSRGNEAEALRLYGRAVDLQPENSDTWYSLARYELLLGRKHDALDHLAKAASLDPHGPAAACLRRIASCR